MGKRGPKPRNVQLKLLSGAQAEPAHARPPEPAPGRPAPPAFLKGLALAEWERIVPELERAGVLTAIDGPALCVYCLAYQSVAEATAAIAREGLTVACGTGARKINPHVSIRDKSLRLMLSTLASFGCDPASRGSVIRQNREPADALAEFQRPQRAAGGENQG